MYAISFIMQKNYQYNVVKAESFFFIYMYILVLLLNVSISASSSCYEVVGTCC